MPDSSDLDKEIFLQEEIWDGLVELLAMEMIALNFFLIHDLHHIQKLDNEFKILIQQYTFLL